MTEEHTPTDDDMRAFYAEHAEEVFRSWHPGQRVPTREEFLAPLDQWMAERDARIRTECAQKARDLAVAMREGDGWDDEWSTREVRDALDIAADLIEGKRE